MAANPLSPDALLQRMADSLPTHPKGDTSSDLSSSFESLALFTHACMISLDFRLLGFSEDKKNESEVQRLAPRLPAEWNSSVSSYSFVYAHPQSSMHFVIKTDRMGGQAEMRGLAVGDERIARFEVAARDYISASALPVRIAPDPASDDDAANDAAVRQDLPAKLRAVFINPARLSDLAALFKLNIVQRLLPSLQKEGYEEARAVAAATTDSADDPDNPRRSRPLEPSGMPDLLPRPAVPGPYPHDDDPLAAGPRLPAPAGDFAPPGFEDEYEINRPPRGPAGFGPAMPDGRSPFNIGHDDLNPQGLGPHDPLRGSFVGGGLPRPGGGGGMHPTFDDPLFGGRGDGSNPQAPPGARWDPVGPRFGQGGRGGWLFGGGGGGFPGGFGGGIL